MASSRVDRVTASSGRIFTAVEGGETGDSSGTSCPGPAAASITRSVVTRTPALNKVPCMRWFQTILAAARAWVKHPRGAIMRLRFASMRYRNVRCLGIILCVLCVPSAMLPAPPDASADEERLARIPQAIQSGDLRGARSELQELLKLLPGDPRIYNLLGVIDAQENDFAAAESSFQKAIQLAPRFTGAYLNLGRLCQEHANQKGGMEKALKVYQKLLEFEPDHVEANYQAAWLLNRLGQFAASLQHLGRLPADAQQRAPALAMRSADTVALGRRTQAESAIIQLSAAADLTEADVLP